MLLLIFVPVSGKSGSKRPKIRCGVDAGFLRLTVLELARHTVENAVLHKARTGLLEIKGGSGADALLTDI